MKAIINKSSDKNFYYILMFSIIFHLMILFSLPGFRNNITILSLNDNKLEVNVISDTNSIEEAPPINSSNMENEQIENIQVPEKNIPIPVYKDIEQRETPNINKNIFKISNNIPLKINPIPVAKPNKKNITNAGKAKSLKSSKSSGRVSTKGVNTKNFIKNYLINIRKKIEKNKKYPLLARKMGVEGSVNVKFGVNKNGEVIFVNILESSGFKILDDAAKNAIIKSQPFPAIPDKINLRKIVAKVTILFKID